MTYSLVGHSLLLSFPQLPTPMPIQALARRGSITVQAAFSMVAMLALVAFALDVGVLYITRTELQRTADAAAMAGAWELVALPSRSPGKGTNKLSKNARGKAAEFVNLNQTGKELVLLREDVRVGRLDKPADRASQIVENGLSAPNAVSVALQRSKARGGDVPLFFARILGIDSAAVSANATAVVNTKFKGFRTPPDGSNLPVLPFALSKAAWDGVTTGSGQDEYRWDEDKERIVRGSDGVKEVKLYPNDTGSSGNYGTVDIGRQSNGVGEIARQITKGVTQSDLDHLGGALEFNADGKLFLNADAGVSAGFKEELASIVGHTRMIPIYSEVTGNGNSATYTIVKFVGVRIVHVDLTGSDKQVLVEPATIVVRGGIEGSDQETTDFIFSPVRLVR